MGEFYCPDCESLFDLQPTEPDACPICGSFEVIPAVEVEDD